MNLKLTRRQFGQAAIATTATAALGAIINKTSAQTPSPATVILGVSPGSITSNNGSATSQVESTDDTNNTRLTTGTKAASSTRTIVVQSFNVGSGSVTTILTTTPILESAEQISGFAALKDGTFAVAATSLDTSQKAAQLTRLIILSQSAPPKSLTVSGLQKQEALVNLLNRKDGSLAGVVATTNGTSPVSIVTINPQTGEITVQRNLPENLRVNTLAECQDGNLYAIAVDRTGETSIVQIDNKGQTIPLRFNDQPWNSGFSGLVCSASNELFALGARRYESPKYIHSINKNTGVMTRIPIGFDVAKITMRA